MSAYYFHVFFSFLGLTHARLLIYVSFMASPTETEDVSVQSGAPSYLVSLTDTEEVSAQSEAESSSSSASSSGDSTYQVSAKSVSDSSSSNSNESDSEILVDEVIAKRPRHADSTNNQHLSVVAAVVPPPFTPSMRSSPDTAVVVPPPFTHPLRQVCGTDTAVVVPPPFTHPFRQVCGEDCLCHNQNGRVRVALRIPKPGARMLDRIGRNQKHVAVASSMPDARTDVPVSLPPPVSDTC